MKKVCIFCGKRPVSKTKEHILPRWLIDITGDSKRSLKLEIPNGAGDTQYRDIAYDALHFPACSECNNDFSESESNAKEVVKRILQHAPLSAKDLDIFLSWLDKIRVGLWLGFLYLSKNPFNISPSFYIAKRLSTNDRAVIIYRAYDQRPGLAFHATNVPMFHHMPSCFTLVINDFYFFNVSAEFLFARRLGFPYPLNSLFHDGKLQANIVAGRERMMLPPIRLPFFESGTEIYQPMFLNEVFRNDPQVYNTAYVRGMSMDWENGVGWPIQIRRRCVTKALPEPSLDWFPRTAHIRADLHALTMRQTLITQADLWDYLYSTKDKSLRYVIKKFQKINKRAANTVNRFFMN